MALTKGPAVKKEVEETSAVEKEEVVVDETTAAPEEEVVKVEETSSTVETATPKSEGKAMAPANPASGLAAAGNIANAIAELAEEGFEDLALGFGAFPMITLPGQMFESSEGHNLGEEFECIIVRKDTKTLHKGSDKEDDEKEEVVYSYDGEMTTNGEELAGVLEGWKEKGWKIERKPYFDVVVQILGGPMEGKIALLSLPPTARTTFSGYVLSVKMQHGCKISEVVTKVKVGPKITKAVKAYYPWAFDCIGMAGEE